MKSPTAGIRVLTPRAAAALLGVSADHVRRLAAAGSLPARDVAAPGSGQHEWRFSERALLEWLEGRPEPIRA
jgi:excisionase family DNA binding protein